MLSVCVCVAEILQELPLIKRYNSNNSSDNSSNSNNINSNNNNTNN